MVWEEKGGNNGDGEGPNESRAQNCVCGRVEYIAPRELPEAARGASFLANWVKKP